MAKTPAFNIVTAYETLDGALRVKEMLDRLAADLQPTCKLHCEFWKLDLLAYESFRAQAGAEASAADMIIVAARAETDLKDAVKSWFESLQPRKPHGHSALVALLDDEIPASGELPRPCAFLQQVASRGNMEFFCQSGGWRPTELKYVVESVHREPEVPLTVLLQEPSIHSEAQGWGIND